MQAAQPAGSHATWRIEHSERECSSVAAPLQAGPVLDRIAKGGTLVIGYRDSSVPFLYLDGSGKPVGYAMDDVLLLGLRAARAKPESLQLVGKWMTTQALAIAMPKNTALNLPESYLLKEYRQFPTDQVP